MVDTFTLNTGATIPAVGEYTCLTSVHPCCSWLFIAFGGGVGIRADTAAFEGFKLHLTSALKACLKPPGFSIQK
jgi:hypothetical protein